MIFAEAVAPSICHGS